MPSDTGRAESKVIRVGIASSVIAQNGSLTWERGEFDAVQ